jgi:hypothetical protein
MDQDQIVTKRLHVSGLTPAITQSDLAQGLASFGTIESLDGFGKFDAVGRPRMSHSNHSKDNWQDVQQAFFIRCSGDTQA